MKKFLYAAATSLAAFALSITTANAQNWRISEDSPTVIRPEWSQIDIQFGSWGELIISGYDPNYSDHYAWPGNSGYFTVELYNPQAPHQMYVYWIDGPMNGRTESVFMAFTPDPTWLTTQETVLTFPEDTYFTATISADGVPFGTFTVVFPAGVYDPQLEWDE